MTILKNSLRNDQILEWNPKRILGLHILMKLRAKIQWITLAIKMFVNSDQLLILLVIFYEDSLVAIGVGITFQFVHPNT